MSRVTWSNLRSLCCSHSVTQEPSLASVSTPEKSDRAVCTGVARSTSVFLSSLSSLLFPVLLLLPPPRLPFTFTCPLSPPPRRNSIKKIIIQNSISFFFVELVEKEIFTKKVKIIGMYPLPPFLPVFSARGEQQPRSMK